MTRCITDAGRITQCAEKDICQRCTLYDIPYNCTPCACLYRVFRSASVMHRERKNIVLFLHQTATTPSMSRNIRSCISFYSYIKPQPNISTPTKRSVVYRSIPTSNRNHLQEVRYPVGCISFYSYIKPQQCLAKWFRFCCCISFYSYIKPQQINDIDADAARCISFYSYIKPQPRRQSTGAIRVVYRSIPTSNRNNSRTKGIIWELYIVLFLHQTATYSLQSIFQSLLYIVLFLHQTATRRTQL